MELNIRIFKDAKDPDSHRYHATSFLQVNNNDGTDRITYGDNPAEIQRLAQLAEYVENMVENYSFSGPDGSPNKADSSS